MARVTNATINKIPSTGSIKHFGIFHLMLSFPIELRTNTSNAGVAAPRKTRKIIYNILILCCV
jgi:hypothetical protein